MVIKNIYWYIVFSGVFWGGVASAMIFLKWTEENIFTGFQAVDNFVEKL